LGEPSLGKSANRYRSVYLLSILFLYLAEISPVTSGEGVPVILTNPSAFKSAKVGRDRRSQ